jgi:hypothetical protein
MAMMRFRCPGDLPLGVRCTPILGTQPWKLSHPPLRLLHQTRALCTMLTQMAHTSAIPKCIPQIPVLHILMQILFIQSRHHYQTPACTSLRTIIITPKCPPSGWILRILGCRPLPVLPLLTSVSGTRTASCHLPQCPRNPDCHLPGRY